MLMYLLGAVTGRHRRWLRMRHVQRKVVAPSSQRERLLRYDEKWYIIFAIENSAHGYQKQGYTLPRVQAPFPKPRTE